MHRRPRPARPAHLAAASAVALALLVPAAAGADPTASIELRDVERVEDIVVVDGTVDVASDPVPLTGAAEVGDAAVPGADIAELRMATTTRDVIFELEIADALPTVVGAPVVMHYIWEFSIPGSEYQLRAVNTDVQALTPGEFTFSVDTCEEDPQTGQGTCTASSIDVDGEVDGGTIRMVVDRGQLGLDGGEQVRSGPGGAIATTGAGGLVWFTGGAPVLDSAIPSTYTVPTTDVVVSTLDADGAALETQPAPLRASGSFLRDLEFAGEGVTAVTATVTFDGVTATDTVELP